MSSTNENRGPEGMILGPRHRVEALLGEGGFGVVAKCRNILTNERVAIKVNKADVNNVRQTRHEISILKQLRHLDPDTCNLVKWNGFFFNGDDICLNFELLDQNLCEYMNKTFLPITELRPILYQLASALCHLGSIGIVHADLKPENVMVVDRNQYPVKVKIVDFGLARPASADWYGACVQTTWYRAPEVMIGIPFNEAIDMWSLGVCAVELATGYPLYPGRFEYEVLYYIVHTQGQPEDRILDCGRKTERFFQHKRNGQPHWRLKHPEEFERDTGHTPQDRRIINLQCLDDLELLMMMSETGHRRDQHLLVNLIKGMMHLDADQRIKPQEVLQHPFFTDCVIEMEDNEEENLDISQQHSCSQMAGPSDIWRRGQSSCSSSPPPSEENNEKGDADQHIKPQEVLQHPFFEASLPQSFFTDCVIEMEDNEDENLDISQQPSCSQMAGPSDIWRRGQSSCSSSPPPSEENNEQGDADQHIKPQEVLQHPFFEASLPQSFFTDCVIEMEDNEDENLDISQQPSCSQMAGPTNIWRRGQSSRFFSPPPSEENNEKGDADQHIKPQEVLQHPFFEASLPQSFCTDCVIEMEDNEDENLDISQQPSCSQMAGPTNIWRRGQSSRFFSPPPSEENNEEGDVQPETNTENIGFFGRIVRTMTNLFNFKIRQDVASQQEGHGWTPV